MNDISAVLRSELNDLDARVVQLEAIIVEAQDRLRLAHSKADGIRDLLSLYESENASRAPGPDAPPEVPPAPSIAPPVVPQSPLSPAPLTDDDEVPPVVVTVRRVPAPRVVVRHVPKRPLKRELIKQETSDLLRLHGRLHRIKILEHLVAKNVMGQEREPLPALAAYLSEMSDTFESDGRGNFMLRKKPSSDSPPTHGRGESGGVAPPVPNSMLNDAGAVASGTEAGGT